MLLQSYTMKISFRPTITIPPLYENFGLQSYKNENICSLQTHLHSYMFKCKRNNDKYYNLNKTMIGYDHINKAEAFL